MIKYIKGDIFVSDAEAIVNPVNINGIMGKGLALSFKIEYPENYKAYVKACKNKQIDIGKLFVFKDSNHFGEKIIINFPTKKDWYKPSKYEYIDKGLDDLINVIKKYNIKSIAIPPLGCGLGGLDWNIVKSKIENKLSDINIDVYLYEPID